MFKSTVYSLVHLPVKKASKPGTNNQLDCKVASGDLKELDALRNNCLAQFEKFRKESDSVNALGKFLSTEGDRDKYAATMIDAAEIYANTLITLVQRIPKFGVMRYYTWTSAITEKQEIAYDDYRYELTGVYYNIGAILMDLSQYALCVRATVGSAAAHEKEAYRNLLKAAGYFAICGILTKGIKEQRIGVALEPLPIATAIILPQFLELVALAQAQEIGANRAIFADAKCERDTAARLCHQAYLLYQSAKDLAQGVSTRSTDFLDVSVSVMVKCDICKALAYSYAASYAMHKTPSNGLWLMERANQQANSIEGYKKTRVKMAFGCEKVIDDCLATIRRDAERIAKINSLVHRAKPLTGTVALPPPQTLAQRAEVRLPATLPPASASISLPPEVLHNEDDGDNAP